MPLRDFRVSHSCAVLPPLKPIFFRNTCTGILEKFESKWIYAYFEREKKVKRRYKWWWVEENAATFVSRLIFFTCNEFFFSPLYFDKKSSVFRAIVQRAGDREDWFLFRLVNTKTRRNIRAYSKIVVVVFFLFNEKTTTICIKNIFFRSQRLKKKKTLRIKPNSGRRAECADDKCVNSSA